MAQKQAAEGKTADDIVHDMGTPKAVAEAAVKDPLKKGDPRQACANAVYDSVYGPNKGHRKDVLTKVRKEKIAVEVAKQNSEAADKDTKATDEQKKAARDAWVKSYNDFEAAHKDYKNLPEEADAWGTADGMAKNW